MQKSKKGVQQKLDQNKAHAEEYSVAIEKSFAKSAHTKESATMPGLGSKKH